MSPTAKPDLRMTQGATFRFLVGQNLKSMTVHADAVAQQSDALRKLVFGDMREAKEREAKWDDVEEATFARFAQFIYTGQYTPADAIIISSSAGARINKEGELPQKQWNVCERLMSR